MATSQPNLISKPLLEVSHLSTQFYTDEGVVQAVTDLSYRLDEGDILGVVGESGCGKTTVSRCILRAFAPTGGEILFREANDQVTDLSPLPRPALRRFRPQMQMIFQDPFASLNPRMRVADIVGEAPRVHGLVDARDVEAYVAQLLARVGLDAGYVRRYPHQFSGGQRARIGIARALAVKPEFLVCDEAVAALDVSIQAQVLNLFMDLRDEYRLTYLFISHDLGVVRHLSSRVVVMYLGRVVEIASTEALFAAPNHPYTQALLSEVPRIDRKRRTYAPIKGEIPSPLNPPSGCHFHPRCPHAMARCSAEAPTLRRIGPGRHSACHLNDALPT